MTDEKISSAALNIVTLNQKYFANNISTKNFVKNLDTTMKDMSLEDLLILGCALTFLSEQKADKT